MELGKKVVTAGVGLFLLGGFSVYLLTADDGSTQNSLTQQHNSGLAHNSSVANTEPKEEMTHDAFIAAAEARREQQQEDKAEIERVEKLRKAKLNSVECKFWKQQQERQTSSTAAKVAAKVDEFCVIAQDRPGTASDANANVNANSTSSASAG